MGSTFETLTRMQAAAWDSAPFENVAENTADILETLIGRLGVNPGERWLDIATGTGVVALRAARKGARVTAQDIAPRLIATARRLAQAEGLNITFDIGDCQQLPYADESFDVVTSSLGAVFAPDHHAVAHELARVCREGARLGLVSWRPGGDSEKFHSIIARFKPPPPAGVGSPFAWGRSAYVEELLGNDFTLAFEEGVSPMVGDSPQALRDLVLTSFGPIKALFDRLDEERREALRAALADYFKECQQAGGSVAVPREYLLTIGLRRRS
jgi:SAM-dependent methyltransferase